MLIELGLELAVNPGLIANELVTNALKQVLPSSADVKIYVGLVSIPGDRFRLTEADESYGLPPGFEPEAASGLGLRVVGSLALQHDGRPSVERGHGSATKL